MLYQCAIPLCFGVAHFFIWLAEIVDKIQGEK